MNRPEPLVAHFAASRGEAFRLDVALEVAAGERVAIMGPSGAGKSTLLAALAGLVRIDAGSIRLGVRELSAAPRGVHVAPMDRGAVLLGQDPRLFPHLTARENIAFGPRARGVARARALRSADEWLERVGMPSAGARRPAQLSGGQQQRVALARALATDPALVLLDEPLTSLDAQTAAEIRSLLSTHVRGTAVMVTHDVLDAVALADRLVVVEEGAITQDDAVRAVLHTPATGFAATLAGVVRVVGHAAGGTWSAGPMRLPAPGCVGATVAILRPDTMTIEPFAAGAGASRLAATGADSAAASWPARILRLDQGLGAVRVHTEAIDPADAGAVSGPPVAVDVPWEGFDAQTLTAGATVRVSVTPAVVRFVPA